MNFDSTHIAIRERGFAEIMDLALHVTRAHAGPLLLALVVGAAPWGLVNWFLLSGVAEDVEWDGPVGYVFVLVMLVALQSPLATALMTLYLGQVTFADRVDASRIVGDFFRCLPQMIFSQGLFRVLLAIPFISFILPYVSWPYLSELILLERNPMFRGKAGRLTTRRRSKHLHTGAGGDLFARWLVAMSVGGLMTAAVTGGVYVIIAQLSSIELSDATTLTVLLPISLWLVAGFFAVVRFLAYLDLRIRREGWEVELTMRAEAERLRRVA